MARTRRSTASWPRTRKGGQHHVCFEVPDIIAARDDMRAKGATVLGTGEPRIGAHGVPVIFVHPKDMGGVLVELMANAGGRSLGMSTRHLPSPSI